MNRDILTGMLSPLGTRIETDSMSRDDIGNYLGLASETVSRTLTQLQQEGRVKMERRHVTIIDPVHLSDMAQHR
ncbi:MAG: CRP-like cAMP-binding protein [Colwellia sp.]